MKISLRGESRKGARLVTKRRALVIAGPVVAAVIITATAIGLSGASDVPFSIHPVHNGSISVTRFGAHALPTSSCVSAEPAQALLPVSSIPNMSQGTDITAEGDVAMTLGSLGAAGVSQPTGPTIAVDLSENLIDKNAPALAIQSQDPFNLSNPDTVTSFSEGISGFSSPTSEATYFSEGAAPQITPEAIVDGHLTNVQITQSSDVLGLPSPNEVVVQSLPGTNVPSQVEITIEVGSTVIGLTFEGGSSLNLADVLPYATQALNQLSKSCPTMDVMQSS